MGETLFDLVTQPMAHDFNKHGPFGLSRNTLEEYIDYEINRMSRIDFLRAISDALEERLLDQERRKSDGCRI